jgi:mono/diheme cytochrome c family protein
MGGFGGSLTAVPRRRPLRLRPLLRLPALRLHPRNRPKAFTQGLAPQGAARLPAPPGTTPQQVALGDRIYHGQVGGAPCEGCHGTNAKGTPLAPDLTNGKWLWGDGSLASITKIITDGVPNPKSYRSPMPPMGGAQLSPSETSAVAAYVWALSHRRGG